MEASDTKFHIKAQYLGDDPRFSYGSEYLLLVQQDWFGRGIKAAPTNVNSGTIMPDYAVQYRNMHDFFLSWKPVMVERKFV